MKTISKEKSTNYKIVDIFFFLYNFHINFIFGQVHIDFFKMNWQKNEILPIQPR